MVAIVTKLLKKSEEAFIVGIEIYNKPTIKYRVEGFSFFICNAWELLLKAYLIREKGNDSIYYKDNTDRTITLENCIKQVFTNDKDPTRKNLEQIIDLRNTSTHFITEEYEQIYVPLFQSCVLNYINTLLKLFDVDITDQLGSNFLTLSVKFDNFTEETIKARYPKQMATHIMKDMSKVGRNISKAGNEKYAIPIRHDFYITKSAKTASATFTITKDAKQAAFVLKELHDMQDECPYTRQKCLDLINKRIKRDSIPFINSRSTKKDKQHQFNSYCFDLFVKFYDIKRNDKYCYIYDRNQNSTYTYSMSAINMIIEEIKKDPEHIIQNLHNRLQDKKGKPTPGAKEF